MAPNRTFAEAYAMGLRDLISTGRPVSSVTDPNSIASNFGEGDRPAVEHLAYKFVVTEPTPTLIKTKSKTFNLPYTIGLFLWTIAGSDSADWLDYYNQQTHKFSNDEGQLCGSFGKRLFNFNDTLNQIELIERRLSDDPASRRAYASILTPDDNQNSIIDYPCAIGVQYFLRDNKLDAIVYMRAQQAFTVLPFDCFVFMGLQLSLAAKLGVACGNYFHLAGTFHIYQSELELTKVVLAGGIEGVQLGPFGENGVVELVALIEFEQKLRQAVVSCDVDEIMRLKNIDFSPGSFCESCKAILMMHAFSKSGLKTDVVLDGAAISDKLKSLAEDYWKEN